MKHPVYSGLEMNIIVLAHRKVLVGERVEVTSRARVMSGRKCLSGPERVACLPRACWEA